MGTIIEKRFVMIFGISVVSALVLILASGLFYRGYSYEQSLTPEMVEHISVMAFELEDVETGDLVEYHDGSLAVVSNIEKRENYTRFVVTSLGRRGEPSLRSLSEDIARIYRLNDPFYFSKARRLLSMEIPFAPPTPCCM